MPDLNEKKDETIEELEYKHETLRGLSNPADVAHEEVTKMRDDQENGKGKDMKEKLDELDKRVKGGSRFFFLKRLKGRKPS